MDSIKIISTVPSTKTNETANKNIPTDAIFDLQAGVKVSPTTENLQKEGFREALFQNLQKEILKPLMNNTSQEANILRTLVLTSNLFTGAAEAIPKEILDGIFITSQDLLSELLTKDKTETIFKGPFFDSLRSLAKLEGHPQLKEAIVSILRHFDAYVNRDQTLKGIFLEANHLFETLPSRERSLLENSLVKLDAALNGKSQNYQETQKLLKNEILPVLRQILNSQIFTEKTDQSITAIIDRIVEYVKGNTTPSDAVLHPAQALKENLEALKSTTTPTNSDQSLKENPEALKNATTPTNPDQSLKENPEALKNATTPTNPDQSLKENPETLKNATTPTNSDQSLKENPETLKNTTTPANSDQALKESTDSIGKPIINRESPLKNIFLEASRLFETLPPKERTLLENALIKLDLASNKTAQNFQDVQKLLKNEVIPVLRQILNSQGFSEKTYQSVTTIIDHIVRYDKGNPEHLESAILRFAQALKPISNLTDPEVMNIKNQIFLHAKEAEILYERLENASKNNSEGEKIELSHLLKHALDESNSSKIISTAQTFLETMLRNESPVFSIMHFLIPLRFLDNNSYGEFFIDKDPSEKKEGTDKATDIFFTVQSDRYGNFEVELLVRDHMINLDIKCPPPLIDSLKTSKNHLKTIIEEQGYQLSNYGIDAYLESKTILQRYPKLALRKVGLDVTI